MGLRAGLDTEARGIILLPLPGIEPRSPGRLARSQTRYSLSCPANITVAIPLESMRGPQNNCA
jgi:hypothetical protein